MKASKILIVVLIILLILCMLGGGAVFAINGYVTSSSSERILSPEEASSLKEVDCILVLGCQVKENGVPSAMLGDRIRRGIELYQSKAASKLLMSGDHGQVDYNEVGTMKAIAIEAGIPSEDVFMDHAGFSTYESLYRAKEIFGVNKVIIVSQNYHLYRALYIADQLGMEAYGVGADYQGYSGQWQREIREILARCKDVFTSAFEVAPTYGGEAIPIIGNGDATND